MNDRQVAHSKAMARKIYVHLASMVGKVNSVATTSDHDLRLIPASVIEDILTTQLDGFYDEIKSVVADMLPGLKDES